MAIANVCANDTDRKNSIPTDPAIQAKVYMAYIHKVNAIR